MQQQAVQPCCPLPSLQGLVDMDFSGNNITAAGVIIMAAGIAVNTSLAAVNLANNDVRDTGGLALLKVCQGLMLRSQLRLFIQRRGTTALSLIPCSCRSKTFEWQRALLHTRIFRKLFSFNDRDSSDG